MGKSKTPEERAAKKERKLEKLSKQSKTDEALSDADVTSARAPKDSVPEFAMEVDEAVIEKPRKEKKSSKKRRLEEDGAQMDVSADAAIAEGSDAPKKKKRKEKRKDVEESPAGSSSIVVDSVEEDATTAIQETKEGKKSKKDKKDKRDKRDKRKKEEDLAPAAEEDAANLLSTSVDVPEQPSEALSTKEEKKKKKKEKKAQANDEDASSPKKKKSKSKAQSTSEPTPPSPSKPRKNRTEFPDPSVDESLSEQARKALDYAFVQFNDPSEWKFNKAKQNWLMRNVWSSEAIPDNYLPLATKYLTQVQGGSREKLKETCKAALSEPVPPPPTAATDESDKTKPSEPSEETSDIPEKPKSILKAAKPVAGAIIAAAPEPPKEPTVNVKKERAQILLDALAEGSS